MLKTLCFTAILAAVFAGGTDAQPARTSNASRTAKPYVANEKATAAVSTLKKLKAKVEVGASPSEYRSGLGDVQYAVKDYLDDPAAKSTPLLDSELKRALRAYMLADLFWRAQVDLGDGFPACDEAGKVLCAQYPEAVAHFSTPTSSLVIYLPACRQASWRLLLPK